ncbi:hypothetical protein T4B_13736 [Trichinella pseudospiralis]|uniref:Uncharacterized protein n=1 Tax=Trichinella pseudospiralis TaxID=6337 RepID=A0A0V1J0B1_TRIPS|nr:hypothetical protein T4B_13736 [Trichinella pseudospiralis]
MNSLLKKKDLSQPIRPSLGIQPEVNQMTTVKQGTFFYKAYIVISLTILSFITVLGLLKMHYHESQWLTPYPDDSLLIPIEPEMKLPDIIEICRNQSTNGHCFTSLEKYATDCTLIVCQGFSTLVDFTDTDMNAVVYNRKLFLEAPDGIPCSETGWCINGKCVETDDIRIREYYLSKESAPAAMIEKNEDACVLARGSDKSIDEIVKHIGLDEDNFTVDCEDSKPVRLHVFSCENPAPSYKGPSCPIEIPFKIQFSVYTNCMNRKWQFLKSDNESLSEIFDPSLVPAHFYDNCRFYIKPGLLHTKNDGSSCLSEKSSSICIEGRCVYHY